MVASNATISEMTARVIMTAYSCLPGFHSGSGNNPCSRLAPSVLDLVDPGTLPMTGCPSCSVSIASVWYCAIPLG
jgi:hypothetical protein